MRSLLPRFLATLAANAVPAIGWFFEQWSPGTMLAIYWWENLVASLLIAARIAIHRRLVPCTGHLLYEAREPSTPEPFLSHFLRTALVFTFAHGVALAVILIGLTASGQAPRIGLDWRNVLTGCGWVLAALATGFAMDLGALGSRSFSWVEETARRHLSRVALVHLSIIFGLLAVVTTHSARGLFAVFVVLKSVADVASVLPRRNPAKPPRWLCRVMDRLTHANGTPAKERFAEYWKRSKAAETERQGRNEALMSA